MRIQCMAVVAAALCGVPAGAGDLKSNGYLFAAPGSINAGGGSAGTLNLGAGGEGIIGKGVGVGAEFGILSPREEMTSFKLMFSPNVYYHFVRDGSRKLDPFVTGGYTLLFRDGNANLFNFGGGVNYWFHKSAGLRVEFRDHVWRGGGGCCSTTAHLWGVRLGVVLR